MATQLTTFAPLYSCNNTMYSYSKGLSYNLKMAHMQGRNM